MLMLVSDCWLLLAVGLVHAVRAPLLLTEWHHLVAPPYHTSSASFVVSTVRAGGHVQQGA